MKTHLLAILIGIMSQAHFFMFTFFKRENTINIPNIIIPVTIIINAR